MKRVLIVLAITTSILVPTTAQVRFGDLDLNAAGELLFSATIEAPGMGEYSTLFLADIPAALMRQITIFPERMDIIGPEGTIQVQNHFGVFRTTSVTGEVTTDEAVDGGGPVSYTASRPDPVFAPLRHFPAFVRGRDIEAGKTIALATSPDGRFIAYLSPTSAGYGDLRLFDVVQNEETTISRRVEMYLDDAPFRWSNDSTFFVYARGTNLYYFSIEHHLSGRSLNEELRRLGPGRIENVAWNGDNTLFYVRGTLVYRVEGTELFTRSLYKHLLKIGTIVGKLPAPFDPNFDRFWISPDRSAILLSTDGRDITVFLFETDDYSGRNGAVTFPHLYLPQNTRIRTVLWSMGDTITVLTGGIRSGKMSTAVYRLALNDPQRRDAFVAASDAGVRDMRLSPDGARAIVWTDEALVVKSHDTWETETTIDHPGLIHAGWHGNTRLVLAGRNVIERIDLGAYERARSDGQREATREIVALSRADAFGFAPGNAAIRVQTGEQTLELASGGWNPIETYEVSDSGILSEDYRVYLENLSQGSYRNMVMVRNIESYGTVPLFPRPRRRYEAFPEREQPIDFTYFSHGSRIRRREVSLVFNAIDSVVGLAEILNTLGEYDIRATFFINGDFIRRHPGAVREIVASGHEIGSLFFTYFDMADGGFRIDADFIKQGLARNEDDFFETTGEELSLLWHAPYYFVSPEIIAASRQMNYSYIGRDVDTLDWVPLRDDNGLSRLYKPTADIIEDVLRWKRPGSIIGMTVGRPGDDRPDGGRKDYLFHRLDLLIDGLIEQGYDTVPVSTLIDNAR